MMKLFLKHSITICTISIVVVVSFLGFLAWAVHDYQDYSPAVITEPHSFRTERQIPLLKGDTIRGEFVARHNNLGIISVKFDTHQRINDDQIQFSLKEKGQETWYYTHTYATDQFQQNTFFPFGFPQINNSTGKTYEIQLQSLNGRENNFVTISSGRAPFLARYVFSKQYFLGSWTNAVGYGFNKMTSYFSYVSAYSYVIILFISIASFYVLKMKAVQKILEYVIYGSATRTPLYVEYTDRLFISICISFLLLLAITGFVIGVLGHIESSEWIIYVGSSIAVFMGALLCTHPKVKIAYKFLRISLLIMFGLFFLQVIYFTYVTHVISYRYIILMTLGFIPAAVRFYKEENPQRFLKALLINGILVFCVSAYFFPAIDSLPLLQFVVTLFITVLLTVFVTNVKGNKLFSAQHRLVSIFVILLATAFIFFSVQKQIDYIHYYFFLGPAYEIGNGKSILSDVPSQYGYLSIHSIAILLKPIGVTFSNFHVLNEILYIGYFIGFFLIYYKLTRRIIITAILLIITVSFQTHFSIYNMGLYPSAGPLRFGMGLIMILAGLYLPKRYIIATSALISAVALFWSAETAIYVIPAWVFAIGVYFYTHTDNLQSAMVETIKYICLFLLLSGLIFLLVLAREFGYHGTFPPFANYIQFITTYQQGYGSLLAPVFGNYYVCVAILIAGINLSLMSAYQKRRDDGLFALSFLCIYNVAVFSYFIGRSHQNNIINISPLFLLEAVMIYHFFFKKINTMRYYLLPLVVFITFFVVETDAVMTHPQFEYDGRYIAAAKNYQYITQKYSLDLTKTLVLSFYSDTLILVENQMKTILPLNPSTMTMILPNYQQKYLLLNLDKIPIGTTVVYANDYPELFDFINNNFMLEEVDLGSDKGIFSIYTIKNRRIKS